MRRILGIASFWLVMAAVVASPRWVFGDTVDNPGPFTITVTSGYVDVGLYRYQFNPAIAPSFSGEVDSAGNITIPQSGFTFPDFDVGGYAVRVEVLGDGSGTIDAVSGDATVQLPPIFLHILAFGPSCGVGPVRGILTTGVSGRLVGQPYDQTTGAATYVNNEFAIPQSSGCGLLGFTIDRAIGLPSPAGHNEFLVVAQFDPVLTGS